MLVMGKFEVISLHKIGEFGPMGIIELASLDKTGQFGSFSGDIPQNFLGGFGLASTIILGSDDDLLLDLIGFE